MSLSQLLYTLTFWLLLRQSVKNNFRKKKSIAAPLTEVTTGGKQHLTAVQGKPKSYAMNLKLALDFQMD